MLRRIAALFLLLAFASQTFSRAMVIGSFYAARAEYAKACENKSRPQLHCGGRCQMMKKMRAEEKKEQGAPERKDSKTEVLSAQTCFVQPLFHHFTGKILFSNLFRQEPVSGYPDSLLRPPLLNA